MAQRLPHHIAPAYSLLVLVTLLVILENNIPVVGSANLEVEIMSSNIPTISRSRECTVCTSGHENDQKMRNVQSVLAVMRMIG